MLLKIGEVAFLLWRDREESRDEFNALCAAVHEKNEEIAQLTQELSDIDNRDNQILISSFNGKPQGTYICQSCGAEYETAIRFCRECGAKMGSE